VAYIVFILKYEWRKHYRRDLRDYIKLLCKYKGIIITEGFMVLDHAY
jgi:putative transposase